MNDMKYDFEKCLNENRMDISVVDARPFAHAVRAAIRELENCAACYKLTNKAYYIETKGYLEKQLARLEAGKHEGKFKE